MHGTIPGGDSLPEFRRTIQHLSDLSDRKDDNGTITPKNEGGVTLVEGYICCPCQTKKNQLLVSGKSARAPGKALTELDASLYSMQDGCDTSCRPDKRKMVASCPATHTPVWRSSSCSRTYGLLLIGHPMTAARGGCALLWGLCCCCCE